MSKKKRHDLLAEALVADDPTVRQCLDALCTRLGISIDQPDWSKWVDVGVALAKEQPEFTKKHQRGRGAPRKFPLKDIDVLRARQVEIEQRRQTFLNGERPTIAATLEVLQRDNPLFKGDLQSLQNSVSRGKLKEKRFLEKLGADLARSSKTVVQSREK